VASPTEVSPFVTIQARDKQINTQPLKLKGYGGISGSTVML
jgi:hypothetical protein